MPVLLIAQPYSGKEKVLISERIDTLLMNFMQKSSLTEPGKSKRDDKVIRDFRNLFTHDATIFDDINPTFNPNAKGYPYSLTEKSRLDYFDGLINEFQKGFVVNNKQVNINYKDFDKGEIKAAIERNISGTTFSDQYILYTEDTLMLHIKIQPDKSVKIEKITAIGDPKIRVINDKDLDGVIDDKDDCLGIKGKISLNGCPDEDNDGIPNKDDECPTDSGSIDNKGCPLTTFAYSFVFSGSIGYHLNHNQIDMPESNFEHPPLAITENTEEDMKSKFGDKPEYTTYKGSITLNANIAYYFGKKKNNRNKGVSIGFSATQYSADYVLKNVRYVYASKDLINDYWRIVTMKGDTETLKFSIVNIPLLFRFKSRVGKIGYEISAGPSFIYFSTQSKYNATFDIEAKYPIHNSAFDFNEENYSQNNNDGLFTQEDINDNWFGSDANTFYNMLNAADASYDFGLNKQFNNRETTSTTMKRSAFALNGNFDLFYHVKSTIAIKAGFSFVSSILKGNKTPYTMVDDSKGSYNSFYNGNGKSKYYSFGLNLGIILGI